MNVIITEQNTEIQLYDTEMYHITEQNRKRKKIMSMYQVPSTVIGKKRDYTEIGVINLGIELVVKKGVS